MESFLVIIGCFLIIIRGVRIYPRTGIKGELIIALSGFILLLSYYAGDAILGIIGFVIFNVGLLILYTFESHIEREIHGQLPIYKRIIGDFPQLLDEKASRKAFRVMGVTSGILSLLTAFEFYRRFKTKNIVELVDVKTFYLVEIGIFIFGGILLILYYSLKKAD